MIAADAAWLVLGAVGAGLYLAAGRRQQGRAARLWWVGGLIVAALVYVAFAVARAAPLAAVLFEAGGVVAYGALASLSLRGDLRFVATAWLLHPLWDAGLHAPGGFALAPSWYVWACLSFDLVVGAALWLPSVRRAGASERLAR